MLPAYAGMIRIVEVSIRDLDSAPRVCGDDPPASPLAIETAVVLPAYAGMILALLVDGAAGIGCSPRMRG